MSSVLSQEEINALLDDTFQKRILANSRDNGNEPRLDYMEQDTLGELATRPQRQPHCRRCWEREITTPGGVAIENIKAHYTKSYIIVDVNYNKGLKGKNVLIIHTYDAGVIVDLMMGGDGSQPSVELSDLHLSAVSEAMNQMMGSSCTSLSQILGKRIDIQPPVLGLYALQDHDLLETNVDHIVKISFRVVIQDLIDSEMMQLLPIPFAKGLAEEMIAKNDLTKYQPAEKKAPAIQATAETAREKPYKIITEGPPQVSADIKPSASVRPAAVQDQVVVSAAQFSQITPEITTAGKPNLDLILDVGLQMSVELGRTHKKIKDILELTVGSVLELDKLAGEPVDILINDKLLAKGEVVVIDENFGVRVTEILSPADRVKNLK